MRCVGSGPGYGSSTGAGDNGEERTWPRLRYTVLDLATATGILGELVAELFAPAGFWADEASAAAAGSRTRPGDLGPA